MITPGIVKQVNISSNGYNSNTFLVEIPIFNSAADSASYRTELECTACLPDGIYDCYHIGDYVYVGFVNNKFNFPVILGKIYKGLDNVSSGSYLIQQLSVETSANLPTSTKIGDLSYSDLLRATTISNDIENNNDLTTEWELIDSDYGLYKGKNSTIGIWANGKILNRVIFKTEDHTFPSDTNFSVDIDLDEDIDAAWWDVSKSYAKEIGQPFYKTTTNNFCLSIDLNQHKATISGRVNKDISSIYATLNFTR